MTVQFQDHNPVVLEKFLRFTTVTINANETVKIVLKCVGFSLSLSLRLNVSISAWHSVIFGR